MNARTDSTTEAQPRNSLAAFWRRLTSISQRNQSPVCGAHPDQCSAKASSDIARSCCDVNPGLDIEAYLLEIEARKLRVRPGWNGPIGEARPHDLSDMAHLIVFDIPHLVRLVRVLQSGSRSG